MWSLFLISCLHRPPELKPDNFIGEWHLIGGTGETFVLVIASSAQGMTATLKVGDCEELTTPSPIYQDVDGSYIFSILIGDKWMFHRLSFGGKDVLEDELRLQQRYGYGEEMHVYFQRMTPELRQKYEAAAAAKQKYEEENETVLLLAELVTSELAYDAAFDTYVACPVWPRPLEALNGEEVPWVEQQDYAYLGWKSNPTSATFMVELTVTGFVAHAWQDLDDDGVLAHWVSINGQIIRRESPEGVR